MDSKRSLRGILQMKGDIDVDKVVIGETPHLKKNHEIVVMNVYKKLVVIWNQINF